MSKKKPKGKDTKTQKTLPKKGEPIAIPIPTESQIARDFLKIVTPDDDTNETGDKEEST